VIYALTISPSPTVDPRGVPVVVPAVAPAAVGYICKLARGLTELDISGRRYQVMDFIPPTAAEALNVHRAPAPTCTAVGSDRDARAECDVHLLAAGDGRSQAEVERGVQDVMQVPAQAAMKPSRHI